MTIISIIFNVNLKVTNQHDLIKYENGSKKYVREK